MKYLILVCLALVGCGPDVNMPMREQSNNAQPPTIKTDGRFTVTRVGVFKDNLAYDDKRGIYVIRDTQTEVEYVGISGIGISEIGRHNCGKSCTRQDER